MGYDHHPTCCNTKMRKLNERNAHYRRGFVAYLCPKCGAVTHLARPASPRTPGDGAP